MASVQKVGVMEKTPYIGALNTKVQIYRMDTVRDAVGASKETPVLVCDTFASPDDNSGGEVVNEKILHVVRGVYTIRKRAGLMGDEKLVLYDGVAQFNVEHVRKLGRSHLQLVVQSTGVFGAAPDDGSGGPGGGGTLQKPTITNDITGYYNLGDAFAFTVEAAREDYFSSPDLPAYLTLNTETGEITGTLEEGGNITFQMRAHNSSGIGAKMFTITVVDYNTGVINPPFDLSHSVVPAGAGLGPAFNLFLTIPYFDHAYQSIEIWINGVKTVTWSNGSGGFYVIEPGEKGFVVQSFTVTLQYGVEYTVTARLYGNSSLSAFSEGLTFTIPAP